MFSLNPPRPGVSRKGIAGTGDLVTLEFEVLEFAEEALGIHNVQLSNSKEKRISYSILVTDLIVVTHQFLQRMSSGWGSECPGSNDRSRKPRAVPRNPRADVNDDGFVNVLDLVAVYSSSSWAGSVTASKVKNSNKASLGQHRLQVLRV